jgi:hypothetical protein
MSAENYSIMYENDVAHVYILVDGRCLHLSKERATELTSLTGKSYQGLPAKKAEELTDAGQLQVFNKRFTNAEKNPLDSPSTPS